MARLNLSITMNSENKPMTKSEYKKYLINLMNESEVIGRERDQWKSNQKRNYLVSKEKSRGRF